MSGSKSYWIGTPAQDVLGILMPPFVALALVLVLQPHTVMSPMSWLILVVGIDVAHVYSTLFRTYWTSETRIKTGSLLWIIPLICFVCSVFLHMISPVWFWRVLAYAAVWHFVRQQYGFMRLYQRKEELSTWHKHISALAIYSATLYPIMYWHLSGDRDFHWMIDGDFWTISDVPPIVLEVLKVAYFAIMVLYTVIEVLRYIKRKTYNMPKMMLIAGTYISWYFGIVYFNGDWAFTALNVISHGIPYLTLIWITNGSTINNSNRIWPKLSVFAVVVLALAWGEEALWDGLIWQDHPSLFQWMYPGTPVSDRSWLNLLVPLLALPQLVHYVLDGFIWKVSREKKLPHANT
ncbi:MAG: hypothetical protein RLZZ262_2111 [Bacteroidota bacterium]|jgi:hypothetical protein